MSRKISDGLLAATAASPPTPLAAPTTRTPERLRVTSMILRIVGLSSMTTTTGASSVAALIAALPPHVSTHSRNDSDAHAENESMGNVGGAQLCSLSWLQFRGCAMG